MKNISPTKSAQLFESAQHHLPGGVNSPVRAFKGVNGSPIFIKHGKGAYLTDVDNNQYIDYVCSWGPLITGHAHPVIIEKVTHALHQGLSFGAPTEIEVKLAQKVSELIPSIEMLRFVNSGTEATMTAIRLARGYTKRNKIIKFSGCYHGHADSLLVAAGSGGLTLGVPNSAGVPESIASHTLIAAYNRLDEVKTLFEKYGEDIACVIVEPVAGNMNCILPAPGFLNGLRALCDQYQSLLIFDEVITGFRVSLGGAQAHYQIKPDITVLGKIIGGGFPVGAFGGRADIMHQLAPLGPVYQAGTLSGNPIAMTAGLAMLEFISASDIHTDLAKKTKQLIDGLCVKAREAGIPFYAHSIGSLFGLFFTDKNAMQYEEEVKACDVTRFQQFFHGMLKEGVYFAPSAFEAGFVSTAHGDAEICRTIEAAEKVFNSIN